MKLFFPTIGTKIQLTKPWSFGLIAESRNEKLAQLVGWFDPTRKGFWNSEWRGCTQEMRYSYTGTLLTGVTLPKGCCLTIDRIYLRKGASDFDSISFWLCTPDKAKPLSVVTPEGCFPIKTKIRFWAKLTDINNKLECDFV